MLDKTVKRSSFTEAKRGLNLIYVDSVNSQIDNSLTQWMRSSDWSFIRNRRDQFVEMW